MTPRSTPSIPVGPTVIDEERRLLEEALIGVSRRDYKDGPCWCQIGPNRVFPDHEQPCQAARAALAPFTEEPTDATDA